MKKEIICTSSISSEDLDYIISNVQKDLTDLPDGLLKTSISNNITQYYIKQDMNDARIAELLKQDAKDLAVLKISKTPSFYINGKPLTEFGPNQLRAQVENEIRGAYQ